MVRFRDPRPGHPFHMHDMILGQPAFVAETLRRLDTVTARKFLGSPKRLVLTGCGTSFHAAMYGARVLGSVLGEDVTAESIHAYDVLAGPPVGRNATVLGVSHSGATETTNRALTRCRRSGARIVALSGLLGSPITRIASRSLVLGTVHDRSWANTMSYTTQLAAFAHLAASAQGNEPSLRRGVRALPQVLEHALRSEASARRAARTLAVSDRVTFLGTRLDEITALEAALKIRETCSLSASAYHVEQFLHGPFLSLDRRETVVAFRSRDDGPRSRWILEGIRDTGARVVTFGDASGVDVRLPAVPSMLRPMVNVVPMQFLAYYAALARKVNPDVMRTDVGRYARGIELLFKWRPRRAASGRPSRPRRRSGGAA